MNYYQMKKKTKYLNGASKYGKLNDGTKIKGSEHPNSKLTEEQVREIKLKLKDGATQTSLGKIFGVDRTVIQEIKFERSWKHVQI